MLAPKTARKSDASNVLGAEAAGGGIGTVIAAIANGLPDGSWWKPMLSVSSPLITVCLSGLWLFAKTAYVDPFVDGRKYKAADAAMDKILAAARANVANVLQDPHATDNHKKEVQNILEKLEKLKLEKITERMEVVGLD